MARFSETLSALMQKAQIGSQRLSKQTGIPRTSIDSWRAGAVRRPQHWRPLLQIGRALALARSSVDGLLAVAGYPSLTILIHDLPPDDPDRVYLRPWLDAPYPGMSDEIEHRLQVLEAQLAANAAGARPVRHQLRAAIADFIGREREAAELDTALRAARKRGNGAVIGAVQGMGGIGKTELAVLAANCLVDAFPDAQIVVPLRGTSADPLPVAQALRQVIHAFTPDAKLPDEVDALQAHYQSVLHGQHVLILADDARDAAQARSLIAPQGCALLITSRTRFTLPGMTTIHLGQLAEAEASELLHRICPRLSTAEAEAIAQACSCLPLALRVSGGILYNTPAMPAADYLARLMDERQRLAYLRDPDDAQLDVAASLALSYTQLDAATQRVFRQLGVVVADFAMPLARAVVVAPEGMDVEATLYLLLRRNLVMYDPARARWRLHDLLRDLARSYLEASGEWDTTWWRYARAALEITQATQVRSRAGRNDAMAALARFDTERPHIDEARRWATAHAGLPQADALLLADALAIQDICYLRYDTRERLSQLEAALAAAQRLDDQRRIGLLLTHLGRVYIDLGAPHQARHYAQQALAIARTLGDRQSEWMALACLAIAFALQGAFRQAIPSLEQALTIAHEQREPSAIARLLALLGRVYGEVGRAADALRCLERAHIANRLHGNPYNQCLILASLGRVYVALRDAERAIATLEHALIQAQALQIRMGEAEILSILGQARAVSGDDAGAVRAFEAALAVLQEASDRWAAAECQWHFGLSLAHQGERERALDLLRAALSYEQEIGHVQAAEHAALLARLEAGEALPADFLYRASLDGCRLSTARE